MTPVQEIPYDEWAERNVLGLIMVNNDLFNEAVSAQLTSEDFYLRSHGRIFEAMRRLNGKMELNYITINYQTKNLGLEVPVSEMLPMTAGIPSQSSLGDSIKIVKERARVRRIAKLAAVIEARALDGDNADDMEADLSSAVSELTGDDSGGFVPLSELEPKFLADLDRLIKGETRAVPTGFTQLDHTTGGGIQPGDVWVIASLTGRGKSSWALHAAAYQADKGLPVALLSREMSGMENWKRLISMRSGVPSWKISPGIMPFTVEMLREWTPAVGAMPVWIDWVTGNVHEVRAKVRRLVQTRDIKALYVDYLQLLNAKSKNGTRAEEVATVSRVFKEIAMENGIGVFALAQFNRYAAHGERPEIHHLAESSGIEKDASVVLILEMPDQQEGEVERDCKMRIAKHRNGPLRTFNYKYRGDVLSFTEVKNGQANS